MNPRKKVVLIGREETKQVFLKSFGEHPISSGSKATMGVGFHNIAHNNVDYVICDLSNRNSFDGQIGDRLKDAVGIIFANPTEAQVDLFMQHINPMCTVVSYIPEVGSEACLDHISERQNHLAQQRETTPVKQEQVQKSKGIQLNSHEAKKILVRCEKRDDFERDGYFLERYHLNSLTMPKSWCHFFNTKDNETVTAVKLKDDSLKENKVNSPFYMHNDL